MREPKRYVDHAEIRALERMLWRDEEWVQEELILSLLSVIEYIDREQMMERMRVQKLARVVLGLPENEELAAQIMAAFGLGGDGE